MSTLPVGSRFGNYEIVRHIGGGGMAQIYLAKTGGLAGFEKHLALKVINADLAEDERFIQMLIDEAKLTVGLTHINIAQVFDLGQVDGCYFIAMEFVDGLDVLELVNGLHSLREKVPVVAAAFIARQIASGLHYAHGRKDPQGTPLNIVHRDISPQNILVSRAGEVKVVDFGIAKAAGMQAKTQAGVIKGKVHYMAPEQVHGEPADGRSDIFSTGIVLWEMLTSKMVYSGDNVRELVAKVRQAEIPAPSTVRPEVPRELDEVVLRALAPDREQRYQNAHELLVALTRFLSQCGVEYSGTHLTRLVGRVLAKRDGEAPAPEVNGRLSVADEPEDSPSVIQEEVDLGPLPEPLDQDRLWVETEEGRVVQLLGEELLLGRAGQLAVADARVSRRHAIIRRQGSGYILEDLGSSNGTYANERRITAPVLLSHGDLVRLGACRMHFLAAGVGQAAQAAPPPVEPEVRDGDVTVRRPSPVAPASHAPQAPAVPAERTPPRPLPAPPSVSPAATSRPRLVIGHGGQFVEQPLAGHTPLTYRVSVGAAVLSGSPAAVVQREDGFYLEPEAANGLGAQVVLAGGLAASTPQRLSPGDSFQLGAFIFTFEE